jgi:hypothetical protein
VERSSYGPTKSGAPLRNEIVLRRIPSLAVEWAVLTQTPPESGSRSPSPSLTTGLRQRHLRGELVFCDDAGCMLLSPRSAAGYAGKKRGQENVEQGPEPLALHGCSVARMALGVFASCGIPGTGGDHREDAAPDASARSASQRSCPVGWDFK